jgi:hypothetical protein
MDTDLNDLRWFKSSASSAAGCVEIAHLGEPRVERALGRLRDFRLG